MSNLPDDQQIHALMKMFDGYKSKIGQTNVLEVREYGKSNSKSWTAQGPVTFKHWQNHLKGIGPGLGIVPLKEDNTIVWGAIDIDLYPADINHIVRLLAEHQAPLIPFRSKSGGVHLYAFFDAPVSADKGRAFLKALAHRMGFLTEEIFPKQTTRNRPDEIGNWLNMPYYGGMDHGRHAIINGKPATLEQFLTEIKK